MKMFHTTLSSLSFDTGIAYVTAETHTVTISYASSSKCLNVKDSKCRCGVIQDLQKILNNPTRDSMCNLGLRKKVKDGNLPVIYQGQKKGV